MDCSQTDKMYSQINERRISVELLLKMVEMILALFVSQYFQLMHLTATAIKTPDCKFGLNPPFWH